MQPGYPPSGQDPYNNPYTDPTGQGYQPPQYGQQPQYGQPQYGQPQYADPYAQPTSGAAFPTSGGAYQDPTSGSPYAGQVFPPPPVYPGGGGYQVPGYGTPTSNQANALGIVSLIVGILAIPLACCGWGGLFLGVAAVITGVLGINKAKQGLADNRGLGLAGIICGGIGAALGAIRLIWSVFDTALTYGTF